MFMACFSDVASFSCTANQVPSRLCHVSQVCDCTSACVFGQAGINYVGCLTWEDQDASFWVCVRRATFRLFERDWKERLLFSGSCRKIFFQTLVYVWTERVLVVTFFTFSSCHKEFSKYIGIVGVLQSIYLGHRVKRSCYWLILSI